jgi:NADH-quinone oxidoreductase subunit J
MGMELSGVFFRAAAILVWGALGLYLMLPRGQAAGKRGARIFGGLLLLGSALLMTVIPAATGGKAPHFLTAYQGLSFGVTYWLMFGLSLVSAVLMVTSRNPIYSALWFAMVLLSNSGLYLLMDASFLSAATVIVYAGAVVVTFLFVVMLAQPNGAASYDRLTREPFLATCVAGLVLSVLLVATLTYSAATELSPTAGVETRRPSVETVQQVAAQTQFPTAIKPGPHVARLGESLFLEHYLSVEVIGVLLLAAVVGAMLIATHRVEPVVAGGVKGAGSQGR